jgi:hypothetical protein
MTKKDLLNFLKVEEETIDKLVEDNLIPYHRIPHLAKSDFRFIKSEIVEWLKKPERKEKMRNENPSITKEGKKFLKNYLREKSPTKILSHNRGSLYSLDGMKIRVQVSKYFDGNKGDGFKRKSVFWLDIPSIFFDTKQASVLYLVCQRSPEIHDNFIIFEIGKEYLKKKNFYPQRTTANKIVFRLHIDVETFIELRSNKHFDFSGFKIN